MIVFNGPVWPGLQEPHSVLEIEPDPIVLDAFSLSLSDLRIDSDVVEDHKVQVPTPVKE